MFFDNKLPLSEEAVLREIPKKISKIVKQAALLIGSLEECSSLWFCANCLGNGLWNL